MDEAIWRANAAERSVRVEPVPESWQHLGGRGLIARILTDEVPARCEPLGPFNKLLFASGLLGGLSLSSCDRLSVGAKSPLTGGIKESNAGGTTALNLTRLGIKALIVEGTPANDRWYLLHLSKEGARFELANELVDVGAYDLAERLRERYGTEAAIAMIGPAGEMRLGAAGILNLDKDGEPSRIAARGGLGAVMGAKRIKAIVVDATGSTKPHLVNDTHLRDAAKRYVKALASHPQKDVYSRYGTPAMTMLCNEMGGLPTRNFSSGRFEDAEKISGEAMRNLILSRGGEGKTKHACMPGCIVRCSSVFAGPDGRKISAPVEYETIALAGSNLGIGSLDDIAHLNWAMNDLGIDSMETGAALGVAAQAGLFEFGDTGKILGLIDEIRQGTPLGRMIGQGAATVGKVFGVLRVPVSKGQAMAGYDPRAIKGTGVTYATSPQGADHTCGNTIRLDVDHLDPCGQADLSKNAQINAAGFDTLGVCLMAGVGFAAEPEIVNELLQARFGWDPGEAPLQTLGRETLALECAFNRIAGFTAADERLPEWMTIEPLPPHDSVFDVTEVDLDGVFESI
jgi:aldehyde:ferredoxin oxidoreductase